MPIKIQFWVLHHKILPTKSFVDTIRIIKGSIIHEGWFYFNENSIQHYSRIYITKPYGTSAKKGYEDDIDCVT